MLPSQQTERPGRTARAFPFAQKNYFKLTVVFNGRLSLEPPTIIV